MKMEQESAAFDAGAVRRALNGTWRFDPSITPRGVALLHFTDRGWAFEMHEFMENGRARRLPVLLWYQVESPVQLTFRFKPESSGWPRGFAFEGEQLLLSAEEHRFTGTRLLPEEVPDWFQQALEKKLTET